MAKHMGMKPVLDALSSGRPIRVRHCQTASANDLVSWAGRIGHSRWQRTINGNLVPRYVIETERRIADEIERRSGRAG